MARLCRIHVTGVGKESARFNPLTIDLRNQETGAPQESVICLRNGGGKTTLISIFYSLLVPNASHFLGKVNGKGAALEDFLRSDQLAVVATEWDLSAMGSPRRVVGQALLLKDRKLIRKYFSFSEVRDFTFDTLPIHGLAPPARSLDKLDDALREAQRLHPAMDLLIIDDTQWRWEEHLTGLGLDPGLFRMHLVMNSQEGGASEIFKIKTAAEFVKRFLELVYDEQSTEEIETTLKLFRQKLAQSPSYRAAIEFGDDLLKHLKPFAQDAARQRDLAQERSKLEREMIQLAVSIEEHLTQLRGDIISRESQISEYRGLVDSKDKDRQRKERLARGYDKRALRLRVRETEQTLANARDASVAEDRRLHILKAAKACKHSRATRAELTALEQTLENLRREHRPELENVRGLGAQLRSAWDRRINNLQAERDLTDEAIAGHDSALSGINTRRVDLTRRRTHAEGQRDRAQAAIRKYEDAQRKLRADGTLDEGETGMEARARWDGENERCAAHLARLEGEADDLKRRLSVVETAMANGIEKIRAQEQERAETETTLIAESRRRSQLEKLPLVVELAEGKSPDLCNPFLLEMLDARAGEAQAELVRLGVETADDKRDDRSLERDGLFAPSVDVEEVLARLKQVGVTSALPFYRWLDEHCTAEQAAERLRTHPSACAGILIQNRQDFDNACRELDRAPVRAPVVLLCASDLSDSWDDVLPSHTVVPEERGLFSKAEAASARPRVERRRHSQAERQDRAEERFRAAHSTATQLREYLREFPAERLASLRAALAAVEDLLASLETEKKRLATVQDDLRGQREEAQRTQVRISQEQGEAKRRKTQANTFVEDHETHVANHRKSADEHQRLYVDAEAALRRLDEDEPAIKSALADARAQAAELRSKWDKAKDEHTALPGEYCGPTPTIPETRAPEEVAPAFHHALAAYEGKIQKGELEGSIKVRRENATNADMEYDRVRGDLPKPEVETAADEDAIDVAIDRQQQIVSQSQQEEAVARAAFNDARRDAPPDERDFKEGDELDRERIDQPTTSVESRDAAQAYREEAARLRSEMNDAEEKARIAAGQLAKHKEFLPGYEYSQKLLPPADGTLGHPAFTGVSTEDRLLVDALTTRHGTITDQLARVEDAITTRYDKHIHPHVYLPAYDRFHIPYRVRLKLLHREDFAMKADEQIQEVETQLRAYQNELDSEEQERRTIVDKLDALARRAANLLGQAETVSAMPDAIEPWAKQPFLRLNVPKKNDPTERQTLLRQAIERWFESGEIPNGHKLAYECLLALCGTKSISVRILKPEYHLSPVPKDITELVTFSDGEKLTAAILLYCVLVRLRARQKVRTEHLLSKDSGMLLLDNPFGKATLAEFVDLQVRMARLMGVQLIYATGINDYAALKHFPHYVRLRNSSRGKSSNDYHVTHDPRPLEGDRQVEGIVLGWTGEAASDGN